MLRVTVRPVTMILVGTVGTVFLTVPLFLLLAFRTIRGCNGRRAGLVRPPIQEILADPARAPFLLRNLAAPTVSGIVLKILIWVSTRRIFNNLVASILFKRSGLDILAGEFIPEPPTTNPAPPLPSSPNNGALNSSNDGILKTLVEAAMSKENSKSDFRYSTIADFYSAYRSGRCTPVDVACGVLKAVTHSNNGSPPLRAVIDMDEQSIMDMARASAERWKEGKPLSFLDGVPISFKGFFRVDPYAPRGGSLFVPTCIQGVPEGDAVCKLRDAGAIIVGIANMQEFGTGTHGSNCNRHHLTARNPHDPHHYCGGSSSGSGSCVAAGLCAVSIGGDGGGSVRIPASVCGVVGLKPTFQLLNHSGSMSFSPTLGTMGPLTSSVLDTAITMNLLLKNEEHSFSLYGLQRSFDLQQEGKPPLEGITVGVYWDYFNFADPEIVQVCKRAVGWLKDLGVEVEDVTIPELEEDRVAHMVSISSEFSNVLGIDMDNHFSEINPETMIILAGGLNVTAVEYINAQRQRTRAVEVLKALFKNVHVIITPSVACLPPKVTPAAIPYGMVDATKSSELMRFSFLANLTGIPGIVLPVGTSHSGFPIGLQLMGPWYQEGLLVQMAWALERIVPSKPRPQVHYDLLPK